MNRDRKIIYASSISLMLALIGALFLPRNNGRIITALILVAFAIAISFLVKKRPILSINKKTVFWVMLAVGAVCLVLYYLTGVHFGFYKSSTPLSPSSFFKNILPIAAIIITIEIIRYVLLAQNVRFVGIFVYVAGVLSEVLVFSTLDYLTTFNRFMEAVGLYLLPAITANFLYNFLSKKYGFLPCIVYRLLMTLYSYVLPIYPQTSDAIFAFVKMIVPVLSYLFIEALYAKGKTTRKRRSKIAEGVFAGIAAVLMLSIVLLITGTLRYHLIVIATESMTGEINKGDAVIYEKYDGQTLQEGTVVVFTKNNKSLIVHRIVDVQHLNGTVYYTTKGDANDSVDSGSITAADLRGVVLFKIPYIGEASLWLRDSFS